MKAKELIKYLQEKPEQDVYLHHNGEEVPVELVVFNPHWITLETE